MPNTDLLLRELNHRVKNNFQIILSLMNLKKRMLPEERWNDLRFIEEHVQALAVTYRLAYASGDIFECSAASLLVELIGDLRQTSKLKTGQVVFETIDMDVTIGLDQAITIALYIAIVLTPYFYQAEIDGGTVIVAASISDDVMSLRISATSPPKDAADALRVHLRDAYFKLLKAEYMPVSGDVDMAVSFGLDAGRVQYGTAAEPKRL